MVIKIHIYLFLMAAYMYAIGKLDTFLIYYIFVIMHEIGHILISLILNVDIFEITLLPVGMNARYKGKIPILKELIISLAGPFASFLFYKMLIDESYAFFNFLIALTNLMPVVPFDGGKIFKNILIILLGEKRGKQIVNKTSKIFLSILILFALIMSIFYKTYYFAILSFYICSIAKEEMKKEKIYGVIDYLQKD